ncbi:hypothetical protein ACIBHY_23270 [Nonomuraea sp. NPDC050547]|uniref:hypothetical protein n=1 Tax=Nonomuraea sp. NPDC050547 TaxID=3364368 RepID=UPI00378F7D5C
MSPRNPRNQIYPGYEDLPPAGRPGILTALWRIRTELLLIAALALFVLAVVAATQDGTWLPFIMLSSAVSVPAATRYGRGWFVGHFWCLVTRHRLQRTCLETTMHTRSGRIPLVLWITPTVTGEKALIMTRAGISAEEFEAYAEEIAAACWARSSRVFRHRKWASLLIVETVRRDGVEGAASPGLDRFYGRRAWVSLRPDVEEPPDLPKTLLLPLVG